MRRFVPWKLSLLALPALLVTIPVILAQDFQRDAATGAIAEFQPIHGRERAIWYLRETAGAATTGAVFSTAIGSAFQVPQEYPRTWEYTGKRWALSASGAAIANGFEAGLGAMWGEDPRYFRVEGPLRGNVGPKLKNIVLSTITATDREGNRMPAYARYMGQAGSNFLQMSWRPESQSSVGDAFVRMGSGYLGRMGGNAFREFWPHVRTLFGRSKNAPPLAPAPTQIPPP